MCLLADFMLTLDGVLLLLSVIGQLFVHILEQILCHSQIVSVLHRPSGRQDPKATLTYILSHVLSPIADG